MPHPKPKSHEDLHTWRINRPDLHRVQRGYWVNVPTRKSFSKWEKIWFSDSGGRRRRSAKGTRPRIHERSWFRYIDALVGMLRHIVQQRAADKEKFSLSSSLMYRHTSTAKCCITCKFLQNTPKKLIQYGPVDAPAARHSILVQGQRRHVDSSHKLRFSWLQASKEPLLWSIYAPILESKSYG